MQKEAPEPPQAAQWPKRETENKQAGTGNKSQQRRNEGQGDKEAQMQFKVVPGGKGLAHPKQLEALGQGSQRSLHSAGEK
jgi:hypothetical protein